MNVSKARVLRGVVAGKKGPIREKMEDKSARLKEKRDFLLDHALVGDGSTLRRAFLEMEVEALVSNVEERGSSRERHACQQRINDLMPGSDKPLKDATPQLPAPVETGCDKPLKKLGVAPVERSDDEYLKLARS